MARFYVLTIEPTLFGDTALVREWGRLATAAAGGSICLPGGSRPSKRSRLGSSANHAVVMYQRIPCPECSGPVFPPD
ncbi:WGR domain-containing protein [Bradyrhizobium diazoefficiens]